MYISNWKATGSQDIQSDFWDSATWPRTFCCWCFIWSRGGEGLSNHQVLLALSGEVPKSHSGRCLFADCVCLLTLRCSLWSNVLFISAITRGSPQGGLVWLEKCVCVLACVFSFLHDSLKAWQGQERGSWLFLAPCS